MKVADVVQEYWNEQGARVYDRIHYIDRAKLKANLLKHLDGNKKSAILDFGTGTGFLSEILAESGYQNLICLDINRDMLRRAQKRLAAYPARLVRADGLHLPLPDNAVDAVVSKWVLWVLPDPEQAIREMVRVTKPGGKIIALDSGKHKQKDKAPLYRRLLKPIHSRYVAAISGASPSRSQRFWEQTAGKLPMYSLTEYTDIFQRQGLEVSIDQEEEYATPLGKLFYGGFKFYLIKGVKGIPAAKDSAAAGCFADSAPPALICPECRAGLQAGQGQLRCEGCHKTFAVWKGIPDLMPDEEKLL